MSSSWYDLTAEIGAIAFVIAVFYLLSLSKQARFSRRAWPAWVVIAVFLSALLWSMWSETLRPLVQAGEYIQAIRTAIGLALIVLSMLLLTYGGFRVVAQVMGLTGTEIFENMRAGTRRYPHERARTARLENARLLFRAARPGCLWMAMGLVLLVAGSIAIR